MEHAASMKKKRKEAKLTRISSSPLEDLLPAEDDLRSTMKDFFDDRLAESVEINFNLCKLWHPRFQFGDFYHVPEWLEEYRVVHFTKNANATLKNAVHALYHVELDNADDRLQMGKALSVGETFSIIRKEGSIEEGCCQMSTIAVAAVTFAQIGSAAVVLFLAVDDSYRKAGFGSQLLMLLGKCLLHRGRKGINLYLLANQEANPLAWSFYTGRGFKVFENEFSPVICDFFTNQNAPELLHRGVDSGLQWLLLQGFEKRFRLGPTSIAKSPLLFYPNPKWRSQGLLATDTTVYARFPGNLSLAECNDCGKGLYLLELGPVFLHQSATNEDRAAPVGIFQGLPKDQFIVSWASRTKLTTGVTVRNAPISMMLGWIQRDGRAKLWRERITLVPTCIMLPLWNMHFLVLRYLQACMYKDEAFDDMKEATFHSLIDNGRFLAYSKDVVNFVLANPDLFRKPYIAMFGENLTMDWTCFIAVNAGTIGQVPEAYQEGQKVCGFIHYDCNADDHCFTSMPVDGDDPYLFFLTLAHHLLANPDHEGSRWSNVTEFMDFFNKAQHSFGEPYQESLNERSSFAGDHSFVQLALPVKYPLRLNPTMEHMSKLAAILFFFDFCASVANTRDFIWHPTDGISTKPLNMFVFAIPGAFKIGDTLQCHVSVSKATLNRKDIGYRSKFATPSKRLVNTFFSSVIVLVDRIAASVYGEQRTSRVEYKRFLVNRRNSCPDLTSLPSPGTRFTDRSHVFNWRPGKVKTPEETGDDQENADAAKKTAEEEVPPSDSSDLFDSDSEDDSDSTGKEENANADAAKKTAEEEVLPSDSSELFDSDSEDEADSEEENADAAKNTAQEEVLPSASSEFEFSSEDDSEDSKEEDADAAKNTAQEEVIPSDSSSASSEFEHDIEDSGGEKDSVASVEDQTKGGIGTVVTALLSRLFSSPGRGSNVGSPDRLKSVSSDGQDDQSEDEGTNKQTNEEDPSAHIREGQPVPLELDLWYEGFQEGSDAARPIQEVVGAQQSLPRIIPQPALLEELASSKKRQRFTASKKDFVAVGPMVEPAKKQRSIHEVPAELMALSDNPCAAGDNCVCPGGKSVLGDMQKVELCTECGHLAHSICLKSRRRERLCPACYPIVQVREQERARELKAREARTVLEIHLKPPPELLQVEKFVRPNITTRMREWLDTELKDKGYKTEAEMRKSIADHNVKLRAARDEPGKLGPREQRLLKKEDVNMKRLCEEWKKCHSILRLEYLRHTRCCVKELCYDVKRGSFVANMEWEEEVVCMHDNEEISVVNREKLVVKDEWVKANYTEGTYNYLKKVARMADGKFMPVPHSNIFMDTRQLSHFKWAVSNDFPLGRWIVKFACSEDTEVMDEASMLEAVGEGPMEMAKNFAKGRGGFLPIPVGNSTGARASDTSDIEIVFQQQSRHTCIYSSFASALWSVGILDIAILVASEAKDSEGDPLALRRLASLVHDHPSWLTSKKIKNAPQFKLLEHDFSDSMAVVVLKGSDGACNHAITVHDGLIFDSNERFAIPLTEANLDLMCSTEFRSGKYMSIASGYLFIDTRKDRNGIKESKVKKAEANSMKQSQS